MRSFIFFSSENFNELPRDDGTRERKVDLVGGGRASHPVVGAVTAAEVDLRRAAGAAGQRRGDDAHARRSVADMQEAGKYMSREHKRQGRDDLHRGLGPEDILVTVGGGDAGGHSAFIPSWSRGRSSIMQHQAIGVCIDC